MRLCLFNKTGSHSIPVFFFQIKNQENEPCFGMKIITLVALSLLSMMFASSANLAISRLDASKARIYNHLNLGTLLRKDRDSRKISQFEHNELANQTSELNSHMLKLYHKLRQKKQLSEPEYDTIKSYHGTFDPLTI